MALSPSGRAARIRARWEMDLSPGSLGSPRRRAAFETDRDGSPASGDAYTSSVLARPVDLDGPHGERILDQGLYHLVDLGQGTRHVGELGEGQRLLAVRPGLVRVGMDFDHD